jgi:hypothetical protein
MFHLRPLSHVNIPAIAGWISLRSIALSVNRVDWMDCQATRMRAKVIGRFVSGQR